MGADGLELLLEAREDTGLPIVSEIMAPRDCGLFEEKVDLVQIGARNMQNVSPTRPRMEQPTPLVIPTVTPWSRSSASTRAWMFSWLTPGFMTITRGRASRKKFLQFTPAKSIMSPIQTQRGILP